VIYGGQPVRAGRVDYAVTPVGLGDSRSGGVDIAAALSISAPGSRERGSLLLELGRATPPRVDLLGQYLNCSDARDGVAAVHALEQIGTEAAVATLAKSLRSAPPLVASYSARALANLNARSELPAIIACLQDRSDELGEHGVRFIIGAMKKLPHVSAVPVLASALRDRRRGVRKIAGLALLRINAPESTAALQVAADELRFSMGWQARRALRARRRMDASRGT
jgi:hypothetical protein